MKFINTKSFIVACTLAAGLYLPACKDKEKAVEPDTTINANPDTVSVTPSTPEISADSALAMGLRDATKDYPGVTATVNDGEVTLTGKIAKDKVPALLQSVNGLNPKKVNNQLTY